MVKVHGLRNKDLKNVCRCRCWEWTRTWVMTLVTCHVWHCQVSVICSCPVTRGVTLDISTLLPGGPLLSIVPALHVWEECEHRSGSRHWRWHLQWWQDGAGELETSNNIFCKDACNGFLVELKYLLKTLTITYRHLISVSPLAIGACVCKDLCCWIFAYFANKPPVDECFSGGS